MTETVVTETVVTVEGLGKRYPLGTQSAQPGFWAQLVTNSLRRMTMRPVEKPAGETDIWALKDISFTVGRGERIGVIGRNGAGKSTLLKILSRVVYPTVGEARVRGRLTSLLEVGTGFNDNLTGRENVFLNASLYGLSKGEVAERFDAIVAFSEVAKFIDTPVKNYSSGMKMRLAFSVAAHLDPDILLMDEVLAVGDMAFQRKCLERVGDMTAGGRTLFFVSHSMDAVIRYCDRCIWLDGGTVRMDGDVEEVAAAYIESAMNVQASFKGGPRPALEAPVEEPAEIEGGSGDEAGAEEKAGTASEDSAAGDTAAEKAIGDEAASAPETAAAPAAAGETEGDGTSAAFSVQPEAFLVEADVVDAKGRPGVVHRVSDKVGVRLTYDITKPGLYVPGIQIIGPEGTLAFVSIPAKGDPEAYRYDRPGRFSATAWIPSHLLNIGTHGVTVSLFSPDISPFKRHFKYEQLLSFQTVEPIVEELSAKGCLPRPLPGPVRPKLDWDIAEAETRGEAGSAAASVAKRA